MKDLAISAACALLDGLARVLSAIAGLADDAQCWLWWRAYDLRKRHSDDWRRRRAEF